MPKDTVSHDACSVQCTHVLSGVLPLSPTASGILTSSGLAEGRGKATTDEGGLHG